MSAVRVDVIGGDPTSFSIVQYTLPKSSLGKPKAPEGVFLTWQKRHKSAEKRCGPRPFPLDTDLAKKESAHWYMPWGWGKWGECGAEVPTETSSREARILYRQWLSLHSPGWDVAPFHCKKSKCGEFYILQEAPWPPKNGFGRGYKGAERRYAGWIFIQKASSPVEQMAAVGDPKRDKYMQAKLYIERLNRWLRLPTYRVSVRSHGEELVQLENGPDGRFFSSKDDCYEAIWKWLWEQEGKYEVDVDCLINGTWKQFTVCKPNSIAGVAGLLEFMRNHVSGIDASEKVVDKATIYSVRGEEKK